MPGQKHTSTPMRNEHYDIVSTLYHALQGAETCDTFIRDAEKAGDKEAVDFFHDVQDENRRVAMKAQELLTRRMH